MSSNIFCYHNTAANTHHYFYIEYFPHHTSNLTWKKLNVPEPWSFTHTKVLTLWSQNFKCVIPPHPNKNKLS